jgi:lipopolysaccharide/colanic/teichoic acid biosynthesis glycosyltransferase
VIDRERGRAERTGGEFSVVAFALPGGDDRPRVLARLSRALARRVRRTDAVGWLDADRLGVVLAATGAAGAQGLADKTALRLAEQGWPVAYTLYVFPSKWSVPGRGDVGGEGGAKAGPEGRADAFAEGGAGAPGEERLEPLLAARVPFWKRATDVIVSAAALVALSPLLLLAAALIKLVSPGGALFRQTRIGRGGRPFVLLKLRSMAAGSDPGVHRRHLAGLIGSDRPMSKLAGDGRVFWLGRLLRRTCVDELPQLVNVLRGEMSLVGPRPCLPYEAEEYARWHSRRFDLAPGMTGLWQVSGKNRLSFPEMVRLDIAYARMLSPWLDMKILLKTPLAVLAGLLPRRRGAEGSPR